MVEGAGGWAAYGASSRVSGSASDSRTTITARKSSCVSSGAAAVIEGNSVCIFAPLLSGLAACFLRYFAGEKWRTVATSKFLCDALNLAAQLGRESWLFLQRLQPVSAMSAQGYFRSYTFVEVAGVNELRGH